MNDEKIDFVMIWVDGSDPKWQEEKIKYSDNPEAVRSGINRYRDWGLLKYWFRGVEKFAPWVNNVYFITCGHYPEWLNLNHPKLKFLKHEDYMPKEYLPTFSSHPIELNLHRIEELSDKFVYFNDDMFLISMTTPADFFKENKPRYVAGCDIIYGEDNDSIWHIFVNNSNLINKYFNKTESIKNNFFKWFSFNYPFKVLLKTFLLLPFNNFSRIVDLHIPVPILKSTMNELWNKEKVLLDKTSRNKFRSVNDVSQYIFREYDIARGNFEPAQKKIGKYYSCLNDGLDKVSDEMIKQKIKAICISDDEKVDFEKASKQISDAFQKIFPDKSSFEI